MEDYLLQEFHEDYLLQEFHEAGIWLPGEKEIAEYHEWCSKGMSNKNALAMVESSIQQRQLGHIAAILSSITVGIRGGIG